MAYHEISRLLAELKDRCERSSQKQVARELGFSETYLSDVLNGRKNPGPGLLKALGYRRRTVFVREV